MADVFQITTIKLSKVLQRDHIKKKQRMAMQELALGMPFIAALDSAEKRLSNSESRQSTIAA